MSLLGYPDKYTFLSFLPNRPPEKHMLETLHFDMGKLFHIRQRYQSQAQQFYLSVENQSPDGRHFPYFRIDYKSVALGAWLDVTIETVETTVFQNIGMGGYFINEVVPNSINTSLIDHKFHNIPATGDFSMILKFQWSQNLSTDSNFLLSATHQPKQTKQVKGDTVFRIYWKKILSFYDHMMFPEKMFSSLVSLPGDPTQVTIKQINHTMSKSHITLFWLNQMFGNLSFVPTSCLCANSFLPCTFCKEYNSFANKEKSVFYFRRAFSKAKPTPQHQIRQSWKESFQVCRSMDSHLPVVRSNKELKEFLALIKLSEFIQPFPLVFISIIKKSPTKQGPFTFTNKNPLAFTPFLENLTEEDQYHRLMQKDLEFQKSCAELFPLDKFHDNGCAQPVRWKQENQSKQARCNAILEKRFFLFSLCLTTTMKKIYHWDNYTSNSSFLQNQNGLNHNFVCSAMTLTNIAEPHWINIKCTEPLVEDILCQDERKDTKLALKQDTSFHPMHCIVSDRKCFKFQTYNGLIKVGKNNIRDIQQFKYLLDAVATTLPPIFTDDFHNVIIYQRFYSIYVFEIHKWCKNIEGLYIASTALVTSLRVKGTLECSGIHFSLEYLCDGETDCHEPLPADEYRCKCNSSTAYSYVCKYVYSNETKTMCSAFYFTTNDGNCQQFTDTFVMHNKFVLPLLQFDTETLLSCQDGSMSFFSIYQICTYQVDENLQVKPCRYGSHLMDCEHFECNMMFKCDHFYCIPWSYVCDGKWDCPGGLDEDKEHHCKEERNCTNLLKCKRSHICVHTGDICDNKADCPLKDDEYFCPRENMDCPDICDCLTYAMNCFHVDIYPKSFSGKLYFQSVTMGKVLFLEGILNVNFPLVILLRVTETNLMDFCAISSVMLNLIALELTTNNINRITSMCFCSSNSIKTIDLGKNVISTIENSAFKNLKHLIFLDLSNNNIPTVQGLTHVNILVLDHNPLKSLASVDLLHLHLKYLKTTKFHVCCLTPTESVCISDKPWFKVCENLLPKNWFQIVFNVVSFVIMVLNILSVASVEISKLIFGEKPGVYGRAILSVNMTDLLCGLYMLLLLSTDFHYQEKFFVFELFWRSSVPCFVIYFLMLNFQLFSPVILLMFSGMRAFAVVLPFQVKLKNKKFIFKFYIAVFSVTFFFSLGTTVAHKFLFQEISLKVCSPFFDPTCENVIAEILAVTVIVILLLTSISVPVLHIMMVLVIKGSQESMNDAVSRKGPNMFLFIHLFVLTLGNLSCWISSISIYLFSLFSSQYNIHIILWSYVFIFPFNCMCSPIIYIATYVRKFCHSFEKIT